MNDSDTIDQNDVTYLSGLKNNGYKKKRKKYNSRGGRMLRRMSKDPTAHHGVTSSRDQSNVVSSYVKHTKGMKVCHLNAQSLLSCIDELNIWLKANPYQIITLSETWLDSTVHDSEIAIPGFQIIRKDRNRHGGGTAIYIEDGIRFTRRDDVEKDDNESIWIEVQQIHQKSFIIGSLYRSQTEGVDYFDNLSEIVDGFINENIEAVLLGDLNCDFLKRNALTDHMTNFMEMHNLVQLVDKPTRITPTSKTLIDVILTTNRNICVNTNVIHHSFSDHGLIETVITSKAKINPSVNGSNVAKTFRSFKEFDIDVFNDDLSNVDWNIDESATVETAWKVFVNKFTKVCDIHAPIKTIRFKSKLCPWLDDRSDIFDTMHERDFHHKKAVNDCNDDDHWRKYKELRNKVNKMMKEAKRDYYTNKIDNSAGDTNNMWKTLKELLPNKKGNLSTLPTTSENDKCLANDFNKHFTSIGSPSYQDASNYMANTTYCDNNFTFTPVTAEEIIDELKTIPQKKASGLDNISTRLLKCAATTIAPILCKIFNMCLTQGTMPDDLKSARVVPIYKNGDKDELTNYRPISILPICSKIIEKIVHRQLYEYVTENKILYNGQSGFRQQHSTNTALIKTIDKWNVDIDEGNYIGAVFVDLSKAFDMVNHKILIDKLSAIGVKGIERNWFVSYLANCTQYVSINGSISTPCNITSGVPQGSILGPLMFLLFINDMPNCIKHSTVDMYADDTLIYVSHNNVDLIEKYLNEDLECLTKWLENNRMKANVNKTKVMLLGTPNRTSQVNHIKVVMNGIDVENVDCFKYLGVTIDANLKWNDHVKNICRKMCNSLGVMRRIKQYVPKKSLITIYNTMILPHIDYAIIIWSNCSDAALSKVQKLQNAAMRIILGVPFRTHTNDMLKELSFMDVRSRISYATGCMMFKVLHDMTPYYLSNFRAITDVHSINTRQSKAGNLYLPKCNINYGKKAFNYKGGVLWNVMSRDIRNAESVMSFKIMFKNDLKL